MRKKDKKPMRNNKEPVCYNCDKIGHYKADCFKNEELSGSSCEDYSDEVELTMLLKRIQRIMKMRKKGKKPTRNNKEPVCYNCGKSGHYKADWVKKKNDDRAKNKEKEAVKGKKKKFYNKKGKRAIVAIWSDKDDSSSESSEAEEVGLMADHEVTSSPSTSYSFLSDSRLSEDDELSHEELVEALSQVCCKLKSVNKENKVLQKSSKFLLFEKKIIERSFKNYF